MPAGKDSPARAAAAARGISVIELVPEATAGCLTLAARAGQPTARSAPPGPDDIALVLHTSGTTGDGKRVPLSHRNVCASALGNRDAHAFDPADRCLNLTPMFHIAHLGTIVAVLAAGSSLVCVPGFDAPRFFTWWESFRPTWYMAVPAMHRAILDRAPAAADVIARCWPRFIRSGAAPLPVGC